MNAIELRTDVIPEDLTLEEFEETRAYLIANVENGLKDPLLDLPAHAELNIIRLAMCDPLNLDKLERLVRNAIRERGDGEPEARRFNFRSYKAAAKDWRNKLEAAAVLRAKMNARNMSIIDGGKPDTEVGEVMKIAPDDTDLQAKLLSNNAFLKAIGMLEAHKKGRVFYDEFYANYFSNWDGSENDSIVSVKAIDDGWLLRCYEWMLVSDLKMSQVLSLAVVEQAVHAFGNRDVRSEPRQWIEALTWDGIPRLHHWLTDVYGIENDPEGYNEAVGRCWILSMVARAMKPGCKVDTMPVLIGPQGNKKSSSLAILGGKWYATINTSVDKGNDFLMSLSGLLVAEVAELDAISKAADSRVKSILSTSTDKFRPPYGRVVKEFARTAVLVGSTNDKGWHKDETGGRRYWPLSCTKPIDVEWLHMHREQLFAEAKVLFDDGASWWDVPKEAQERRIAEHYSSDVWEDRIQEWIGYTELYTGMPGRDERKIAADPGANEERGRWGTLITTSRIAIQCLGVTLDRVDRRISVRIARIMNSLGFESKPVRIEGKLIRAWVVTEDHVKMSGQLSLQLNDLED